MKCKKHTTVDCVPSLGNTNILYCPVCFEGYDEFRGFINKESPTQSQVGNTTQGEEPCPECGEEMGEVFGANILYCDKCHPEDYLKFRLDGTARIPEPTPTTQQVGNEQGEVTISDIQKIANKWYEIYENDKDEQVRNSYDAIYFALKEMLDKMNKPYKNSTEAMADLALDMTILKNKEIEKIKSQLQALQSSNDKLVEALNEIAYGNHPELTVPQIGLKFIDIAREALSSIPK